VGGILKVSPAYWVKRRLLEGHNETFWSYYKGIKQKAKAVKRDLKKEQSSRPAAFGLSGLDKYTSICASLQFLAVLIGWVLCRGCTLMGGNPLGGIPGLLVRHGYMLVLVPMLWAPLMIVKNTSNRLPAFVEKPLGAFGFIAVFVILGYFIWLAMALLASAFPLGDI